MKKDSAKKESLDALPEKLESKIEMPPKKKLLLTGAKHETTLKLDRLESELTNEGTKDYIDKREYHLTYKLDINASEGSKERKREAENKTQL